MTQEQIYQIAELTQKTKELMEEQRIIKDNLSLRLFDPTFVIKEPGVYKVELTDKDRAALVENRQVEINKLIYTIEQILLATGRD